MRLALVVAANGAVIAALVVLTLAVDDRETFLYGDVFALLALGLTNFLLWKVRPPRT